MSRQLMRPLEIVAVLLGLILLLDAASVIFTIIPQWLFVRSWQTPRATIETIAVEDPIHLARFIAAMIQVGIGITIIKYRGWALRTLFEVPKSDTGSIKTSRADPRKLGAAIATWAVIMTALWLVANILLESQFLRILLASAYPVALRRQVKFVFEPMMLNRILVVTRCIVDSFVIYLLLRMHYILDHAQAFKSRYAARATDTTELSRSIAGALAWTGWILLAVTAANSLIDCWTLVIMHADHLSYEAPDFIGQVNSGDPWDLVFDVIYAAVGIVLLKLRAGLMSSLNETSEGKHQTEGLTSYFDCSLAAYTALTGSALLLSRCVAWIAEGIYLWRTGLFYGYAVWSPGMQPVSRTTFAGFGDVLRSIADLCIAIILFIIAIKLFSAGTRERRTAGGDATGAVTASQGS